MKREFLKELGLEDAVIDKIMGENGKDIEGQKATISTLQGEITKAKENVTDLTKKLTAFESVDIDKLKSEVKEWESKYNNDTAEIKKKFAIENAVKGFKALDVLSVLPHLDLTLVKLDGEKILGLEEQITKLKTDKGFLFETEKPADGAGGAPQYDANGKLIVVNSGGQHGGGGGADYSKMSDAEYYATVSAQKK